MSYYESNYYRNPGPVYGPDGDRGAPVPGWGMLPNMAGPARVGVGQPSLGPAQSAPPTLMPSSDLRKMAMTDASAPSGGASSWIKWVVAGVGVGLLVAVAKNRGMLGGRR